MTRKLLLFISATLLLLAFGSMTTQAEVSVGLSIDKEGIKSFHLSIGEHYHVEEQEIVVLREKKIHDEELAVLFYLADRAGVSHLKVLQLRLKRYSWMAITHRLGLTAEIFYLSLKSDPGPPYGKAWGQLKKGKENKKNRKKAWAEVSLSDFEIINFVNLRFLSEKYGYAPEDVIRLRYQQDSFISINSKIKKAKGLHKKHKLAQNKPGKKPGKGNGKKK